MPNNDDSNHPGQPGQGQYIEYRGQVESMPADLIGDWIIGGRTVRVSATTQLDQSDGPFQVGAWVKVEGYQQPDGVIQATKLETEHMPGGGDDDGDHSGHPGQGRRVEFYGQIQSMPANGYIGDWVISGRTVRVTPQTRLKQEDGPFQVGAWVEVKGYEQNDGSIEATKIETKYRGHGDDGIGLPEPYWRR